MWSYLPKYLVKIDMKSLHIKRALQRNISLFYPIYSDFSSIQKLDKLKIGWITKDNFQNGYYEQS